MDGTLDLAQMGGDLDDSSALRDIEQDDDGSDARGGSSARGGGGSSTGGDGLALQAGGERVPPFLSKLFQIVSQPQTDHCVRWSSAGDSFVIADHHIFSKQVLPNFFKHSSLCSFIRQLNTYGFRKRTNMGSSSDQMEFFNDNFRRGHLDLLSRIKRTGQTKGPGRGAGAASAGAAGTAGVAAAGTIAAATALAGAPGAPPGVLQMKPAATTAQHATKGDLSHVQGQVNQLITEVRDMRTLMHQYMMEVDKRVNLFTMEMHGGTNAAAAAAAAAGTWYQPGNGGIAPVSGPGTTTIPQLGPMGGGPPPPLDLHGAPTAATLAAMASQTM